MLRITLYKNCILNETYQNVFSKGNTDATNILKKYLKQRELIELKNKASQFYFIDDNANQITRQKVYKIIKKQGVDKKRIIVYKAHFT